MLKILQARLQQYMNWELPDIQAGFRKGRGTRNQIANIHWITEKAREFQKHIYFCFIDYAKAFDCVNYKKLWKILRDGTIRPPYLPPAKPVCRSRSNSYSQTWNNRLVQNWERVHQGWILSPCLFNLYAEDIMRDARWMKHKLESRLPGEKSITSDMQTTPPLWQKARRDERASWWRWKSRVKKLALNSTFKKLRSWHPVSSLQGK